MADAASRTTDTAPTDSESGPRRRTGVRYALELDGHRLTLPSGKTLIGRGADCQVVLDSALVSRRHARVVVAGTTVVVEDLGSRNGVLVNGALITGGVTVLAGDHIQIGGQHLTLRQDGGDQASKNAELRSAKTIEFDAVQPPLSEERTNTAHALELLSSVVDKSLALGRTDEAERMLSRHLQHLLRDVESETQAPEPVAELGVRFAIKLAEATHKAGWINYSFRVYLALGRPLPMEIVHELYTLLRKVRGVDVSLLRKYISRLQSCADELSPTERFAAKRIEGLTTLTGL